LNGHNLPHDENTEIQATAVVRLGLILFFPIFPTSNAEVDSQPCPMGQNQSSGRWGTKIFSIFSEFWAINLKK
jgi:hypothetical protein